MFNFHKPRVYRSADGCCICRAKSSSSRFTASRKYEKESMQCFNLHEPRNGEICNACVLLVKRYKRLPVGSKRHWGHVVDARAGPGTKSLAKQKKREFEMDAKTNGGGSGSGGGSSLSEKFAKILKKNRKVKSITVAPSMDQQQQLLLKAPSTQSEEQHQSDSNESFDDEHHQQQQLHVVTSATVPVAPAAATPYQTRKRTAAAAAATTRPTATTTHGCSTDKMLRLTGSKRRRMLQPMKHRRAVDNVPFFEQHDLLRLDVCCGTVFQSLSLGSACYIIDTELYKPCEKHRRRGRQQQQVQQQQQQHHQHVQQQQLELQKKALPNQVISTPALKKHHLYFKRQSESFPQGEIHRISPIPIPLQKTEVTTTVQQQQQHSTATNGGSLTLILKSATPPGSGSSSTVSGTGSGSGLHASMLATTAATTTAVGAASPSSLSSSSNCSTSSSVATKFNDNSSDSGFDEHVLERKSVSPPTQDDLQLDNKKLRGGIQRLILASGLPISGQTQNLVLTGNEFTARFIQRQQQSLKITAAATGTAATAPSSSTTTTATGSQSSGNCNKMRAIFNNANTIQHENGVTTILPASSIAASNQTAAMNAIAPSTVTITPAKINNNNSNTNNNNINNSTANNTKFILLKPTIGKAPTEVKIA